MAALLDVSDSYVKRLRSERLAPRFIKGHSVRRGHVPCASCGELFYSLGPAHIYCSGSARRRPNSSDCARLAAEHRVERWAQVDRETAERAAARVMTSEKRTLKVVTATLDEIAKLGGDHDTALVIARQRLRTKQLQRPKLKYAQAFLDPILDQHRSSLHRTFETTAAELIEAVRWRLKAKREQDRLVDEAISRDDELAALVQEQQRDARWGDRMPKWILSLQQPAGEGRALGDFLRAPDSASPYQIAVGQLIRDTLSGRDLDDIEALDDVTREWLQTKLGAAGLVEAPLVTRPERDFWLPLQRSEKGRVKGSTWDEMASLGGVESPDRPEHTGSVKELIESGAKPATAFSQPNYSGERLFREFKRREKANAKRLKRMGLVSP